MKLREDNRMLTRRTVRRDYWEFVTGRRSDQPEWPLRHKLLRFALVLRMAIADDDDADTCYDMLKEVQQAMLLYRAEREADKWQTVH